MSIESTEAWTSGLTRMFTSRRIFGRSGSSVSTHADSRYSLLQHFAVNGLIEQHESHLIDLFGRDQKIICPHRDPVNIVCSIVRTSEYTSSVYSDILKKNKNLAHKKARRIMQMLAVSAEKHIRWREQNTDIEILDLSYQDINRNTVDVLRKVYRFLDLELTSEIEQTVIGWEQDKDRNRFARNTYAAEEFGLTDDQIRDAFQPYIARFSEFI